MITATGLELRAGSRILLGNATFRVAPGDRVGLVGRNGAGKTTLTRVLAGEGVPAAGEVTRSGHVGYLPQDPRTGDLDVLARHEQDLPFGKFQGVMMRVGLRHVDLAESGHFLFNVSRPQARP